MPMPTLRSQAPGDELMDSISIADGPNRVARRRVRAAAAMWQCEAMRVGAPDSVIKRRTPDAFTKEDDELQHKWVAFAIAAERVFVVETPEQLNPVDARPIDADALYDNGWNDAIASARAYANAIYALFATEDEKKAANRMRAAIIDYIERLIKEPKP